MRYYELYQNDGEDIKVEHCTVEHFVEILKRDLQQNNKYYQYLRVGKHTATFNSPGFGTSGYHYMATNEERKLLMELVSPLVAEELPTDETAETDTVSAIQLHKSTMKLIKSLGLTPGESYENIILRLIKEHQEENS